jgi:PadR family transcriptional regulator AphA
LLAAQPMTPYELAKQVSRGLRLVWPRAEGRIYDEPKLLAEHGLARGKREHTGQRPRTVYSITPKGRRSLRRWLAAPGNGPILEYEALLKVANAGVGTRADLLGHISTVRGHAAAHLEIGLTRADEYTHGLVPLPEHLAINGLMWNFLWMFFTAIEEWAIWATAEVSRWPEDLRRNTAADTRTLELLGAALDTARGH